MFLPYSRIYVDPPYVRSRLYPSASDSGQIRRVRAMAVRSGATTTAAPGRRAKKCRGRLVAVGSWVVVTVGSAVCYEAEIGLF